MNELKRAIKTFLILTALYMLFLIVIVYQPWR